MNAIITNLKRASIETILLALLMEEDMYGYQLAQEIKKRTDGRLSVLEGSMYPILTRLKENGDVTFHTKIVGKKMKRVYYHITDSDRQHYEEMKATFNDNVALIQNLI